MCSWLKRTKLWELRTVQGLIVWHMLSRYTPKLDGSKISNLPIDWVYPIYVHYGKFKEKPTYPDAINLYLQDTQVFFHAYVLTIAFPIHVGNCWVLVSVNGKRKEKISKVRELLWRENEKSFAKCKWKVISYKFAGNGNISKSCYSFRKVVTFQKVVIFRTDTIFRKVVIFSKRHNFLDKMGLNRFHWTDMFLAETGYKRKWIFDFLNYWNFFFFCVYFSLK